MMGKKGIAWILSAVLLILMAVPTVVGAQASASADLSGGAISVTCSVDTTQDVQVTVTGDSNTGGYSKSETRTVTAGASTVFSFSLNSPGYGKYTWSAKSLADTTLNESGTKYNVPLNVSASSPSAGTLQVNIESLTGAPVQVTLDGTAQSAVQSASTGSTGSLGTFSHNFTGLSEGSHTLAVTYANPSNHGSRQYSDIITVQGSGNTGGTGDGSGSGGTGGTVTPSDDITITSVTSSGAVITISGTAGVSKNLTATASGSGISATATGASGADNGSGKGNFSIQVTATQDGVYNSFTVTDGSKQGTNTSSSVTVSGLGGGTGGTVTPSDDITITSVTSSGAVITISGTAGVSKNLTATASGSGISATATGASGADNGSGKGNFSIQVTATQDGVYNSFTVTDGSKQGTNTTASVTVSGLGGGTGGTVTPSEDITITSVTSSGAVITISGTAGITKNLTATASGSGISATATGVSGADNGSGKGNFTLQVTATQDGVYNSFTVTDGSKQGTDTTSSVTVSGASGSGGTPSEDITITSVTSSGAVITISGTAGVSKSLTATASGSGISATATGVSGVDDGTGKGNFSIQVTATQNGVYNSFTVSDGAKQGTNTTASVTVSGVGGTGIGTSEEIAITTVSATDTTITVSGTAGASKNLTAVATGTGVSTSAGGTSTADNGTGKGTFAIELSPTQNGVYNTFQVSDGTNQGLNTTVSINMTNIGVMALVSMTARKINDTTLGIKPTFEAGKTLEVTLVNTNEKKTLTDHTGNTELQFTIPKPTVSTLYAFRAAYSDAPTTYLADATVQYDVTGPAYINIQQVVDSVGRSIRVTGVAEPGKTVVLELLYAGAVRESVEITEASGSIAKTFSNLSYGTYTVRGYYKDGTGATTSLQPVTLGDPNAPMLQVDLITNGLTVITGKTVPGLRVTVRTDFGGTQYTAGATADSTTGVFRIPLVRTQDVGKTIDIIVTDASNVDHTYTFTVVQATEQYRILSLYSSGSDVAALQQRLKDLLYDVDVTGYYDYKTQNAVRSFQYINGLGLDGIAGRETQVALFSVAARPYTSTGTTYIRLQRGDRNSQVTMLQTRLAALGYYTIRIDGIFGIATEAGVRAFQLNNGLAGTGIADDITQSLLYSGNAKPIGSVPNVYTTLQRGSRGAEVSSLQTRLAALGYYKGLIDGIYGSQTEAAVRSFQGKNNLSRTGRADTATQSVLFSNNAWPKTGGASSGGSSSSTGYVYLYWGCENEAVKRLQTALKNLGYYSGNIDGQYYNQTYNAVRAFQRNNGLAVDGIAGRKTQNKLYGTNY